MNHPAPMPRFPEAIQELERLRLQIIAELKSGKNSRLHVKIQLEDAIQCLKFCEDHKIKSSATVVQLPETRTHTPSSEYRIVEDHESDDRGVWTELQIGTQKVRPSPGVLLVDCGLWPNDATA